MFPNIYISIGQCLAIKFAKNTILYNLAWNLVDPIHKQ